MELTDGDDTLDKVRLIVGVGLVEHTLVAVARGTGLTGVDTGNDHDLVLNLFLNVSESGNVVENAILVVCGAGSDDEKELVGFTAEDLLDFDISRFLDRGELVSNGVHFLNFLRNRQFADEFHIHDSLPSFLEFLNLYG